MSIFSKIFGTHTKETVNAVERVVDGLTVSDQEKSNAKAELVQVVQQSLVGIATTQAEVLKQEMRGNWLQKSWRPIVMLCFTALLVIRWTGISSHEISLELEMKLMELLKFGMGGYIVGRSVEKVAETATKNIDLPFLKKRHRHDYLDPNTNGR